MFYAIIILKLRSIMFISRIIGKTIISSALIGGTFLLYKRIKNKKKRIEKAKEEE